MRIEISQSSIDALLKKSNYIVEDINETINSMKKRKDDIDNISGGYNNATKSASDNLSTRINKENIKKVQVQEVVTKMNDFIDNVVAIDQSVASTIKTNQKQFYAEYSWLKPTTEEKGGWLENCKNWIKDKWNSAKEKLSQAWNAVCDWVSEHWVELVIGTIGVVVGVVLCVLTGGTVLAALAVALKTVAVSMITSAVINGGLSVVFGGNFWEGFLDGLASGYMFGGLAFGLNSIFNGIDYFRQSSQYYKQYGGSYKELRKLSNSQIEEVHHMPAKSSYKGTDFNPRRGTSIIIDKADHKLTSSFDNKAGSKAYRLEQSELIKNGEIMKAFDVDVQNIRNICGHKYDAAIKQARKYLKTLIKEGVFN